jgi:hypothetical protein
LEPFTIKWIAVCGWFRSECPSFTRKVRLLDHNAPMICVCDVKYLLLENAYELWNWGKLSIMLSCSEYVNIIHTFLMHSHVIPQTSLIDLAYILYICPIHIQNIHCVCHIHLLYICHTLYLYPTNTTHTFAKHSQYIVHIDQLYKHN